MKKHCEQLIRVDDGYEHHTTETCGGLAQEWVILPYRGVIGLCHYHQGLHQDYEHMNADQVKVLEVMES